MEEKKFPLKGVVPDKFKLAGQEYKVSYDSSLTNSANLGESDMTLLEVKINTFCQGKKVAEGSYTNTFYHELVHQILDNMGEFKLSSNEKFVNCFSMLLSEVMQSISPNREEPSE